MPAVQVAGFQDAQYVHYEDVPPEIIARERDIELNKEDIKSKPEKFRSVFPQFPACLPASTLRGSRSQSAAVRRAEMQLDSFSRPHDM